MVECFFVLFLNVIITYQKCNHDILCRVLSWQMCSGLKCSTVKLPFSDVLDMYSTCLWISFLFSPSGQLFSLHIQPSLSQAVTTLSTMFTEMLLALVIGGLLFFLVQRNRNQVLKTEDGWWGAGVPPDGVEDVTIHPFKVTTSDEELEVRQKLCLFTWD